MEKPSAFIVKAIVAIMLASLVAPPFWASADSTIVNHNTSEDAEAESGPATATTILDVTAGPEARANAASAVVAQEGDNEVEADQSAAALSGDAVAGSQVGASGILTDDDTAVENTNVADDPQAESGEASAAAVASAASGPLAESGFTDTATATVVQDGDNEAQLNQSAGSESGSAAAGSQFQATSAQGTPSAVVAWLAFALIGTYMLLMLTRRSPATEGSAPRPNLLTDADMGATLRIPSGWASNRAGRVFAMFDPSSSSDGSIDMAEMGVLCTLRWGSDEAGPLAAQRIAKHSSYRHVDSGYVHVAGHRAFHHTYELALDDRAVRIREHFVPRDDDGRVLRVVAFASSDRAETLPGIDDVLHRLEA